MKKGKIIFQVMKWLVILTSLIYIFNKLNHDNQIGTLLNELQKFKFSQLLIILFVMTLMVLNWTLESIKFRLLLKPVQKITIKRSIQAVLAGITVSIFTPKRIGEFGGRIFVLDTPKRVSGIFATMLGNLSQLLITLLSGIIFLPFYFSLNAHRLQINQIWFYSILIIVVVIVLLLFVYFKIAWFGQVITKIKFFKKHTEFVSFLQYYDFRMLLVIISISLLRYAVFTFQFFLLMQLFGINLPFLKVIMSISQIYFIMAVIPTFALGELGVRSSVAIWVFSIFTSYALGIFVASMMLWVINLALPAIIGIYFLSKLKY